MLQQPPKHTSHHRSTLERDLIEGNTQRFKLSVSNPTVFENSSSNSSKPYQGEGQRQAWNRGREEEQKQIGGAEGFSNHPSGSVDDSSRGHQYSGDFSNGRDGESPPNGDVGVESEGGIRAEKRKTFGGYDLNPREIYRKLSEHVIGQVEGRKKGESIGWRVEAYVTTVFRDPYGRLWLSDAKKCRCNCDCCQVFYRRRFCLRATNMILSSVARGCLTTAFSVPVW